MLKLTPMSAGWHTELEYCDPFEFECQPGKAYNEFLIKSLEGQVAQYIPVIKEINYYKPCLIYGLCRNTHSILLDSAMGHATLGRYSFIGIDPFTIIKSKKKQIMVNETLYQGDLIDLLKILLKKYPLHCDPDLPPMQNGFIGYLGYDFCCELEKIPRAKEDNMDFYDLYGGLYDLVIAFDNEKKRAWIISSGHPEENSIKRSQRAFDRLHWLLNLIARKLKNAKDTCLVDFDCSKNKIVSNFTKKAYLAAVNQVKKYISAGDIFEANISQCFKLKKPQGWDDYALYLTLKKINPAPFSAFIQGDNFAIASASPERFLKLSQHQVEARPIKGTCARLADKKSDQQNILSLSKSKKDRAENIMITDLMRNDLSRVCKPHTINVPQLCGLETYQSVHHLVSVVTGELKPELDATDLLKAAFPAGSITGAPKIRAMEIIYDIEPSARGPYCGAIGYIGFDGVMDMSVVIRTFCMNKEFITFQAGGAVTIDSDASKEYEETLIKAKSLFACLTRDIEHEESVTNR